MLCPEYSIILRWMLLSPFESLKAYHFIPKKSISPTNGCQKQLKTVIYMHCIKRIVSKLYVLEFLSQATVKNSDFLHLFFFSSLFLLNLSSKKKT